MTTVDPTDPLYLLAATLAPDLPALFSGLLRLARLAEGSPWPEVRQAALLLRASTREVMAEQHWPTPLAVDAAELLPVDFEAAALLTLARWYGEQIDRLDQRRGPLLRVGWAQAAWDLTLLEVKLEGVCRAVAAPPPARDTLRESAGPTDPAPAPEEAA